MFENIIENILLGWVPDWFWAILEYWPWIIGAIGTIFVIGTLYRIYQFGGWPALSVAMGAVGVAIGYWLGIRSDDPKDTTQSKPLTPTTKVTTPNQKRPTIFDGEFNPFKSITRKKK